jgi:hypothetical protein
MTSVAATIRQVSSDSNHFVNVAAIGLVGTVTWIFDEASTLAFVASPTTAAGSGPATIAASVASRVASAAVGSVFFKDMGVTLSASTGKSGTGGPLLFRKVQLVTNDEQTFGVGGNPASAFLTGYILIARSSAVGSGIPIAPLAKHGL